MASVKKSTGGRPPKWDSPEKMQEAIDKYFASCKGEPLIIDGEPYMDNFGEVVMIGAHPPTVTGLALALGFCSREGLLFCEGKAAFADTIKRAKSRVEEYAEGRLFDRDGQRGAEFSLKCNFRWKEPPKEIDAVSSGSGGGIVMIPAVIQREDDQAGG